MVKNTLIICSFVCFLVTLSVMIFIATKYVGQMERINGNLEDITKELQRANDPRTLRR